MNYNCKYLPVCNFIFELPYLSWIKKLAKELEAYEYFNLIFN